MAWADIVGNAYRRHVAGECSIDELLATIRQFRPTGTANPCVPRETAVQSRVTPASEPEPTPSSH